MRAAPTNRSHAPAGGRIAVVLLLGLLAAAPALSAAETIAIDRIEHIHGIAPDPERQGRLYVATHAGLFLASPDGTARRVSETTADLMSFAAQGGRAGGFLASGHAPDGENLGVMISRDHGRSWKLLAEGAGGPVDFHALTVSPADPQTVYGMYQGLQVSHDGGGSWRMVGPLPDDTFDLAASALDPDRLYAATRSGLYRSTDGGASWTPVFPERQKPVTLVHVAADGSVYAFFYGVGLVASGPDEATWDVRARDFADRYLLHMADDPTRPGLLHVVPDTGALLTSRDGGRSWTSYAGHGKVDAARIAEGERLYTRLCQACHGENGVGERPGDPSAIDAYGFVAPALDDSAHAWHHSDDNLVETILGGSPRNPRMLGFDPVLTRDDAEALVTYLKSLWSFRSLACQGTRHMSCMH